MLLQDLKEQAIRLTPSERISLVSAIIASLQDKSATQPDRSAAIGRMRGLLRTNQPAPTDDEVTEMLEVRRNEQYLQ